LSARPRLCLEQHPASDTRLLRGTTARRCAEHHGRTAAAAATKKARAQVGAQFGPRLGVDLIVHLADTKTDSASSRRVVILFGAGDELIVMPLPACSEAGRGAGRGRWKTGPGVG